MSSITVTELVLLPGADPITFELESDAVTGLVGLERNGQEEFLQVLCGLRRPISGQIRVGDRTFGPRGIGGLREAAALGIAYLPRERKTEGILPNRSVLENFAIATLPRYSKLGIIDDRRTRAAYDRLAADLGIVCESPNASISTLSGGNQQKVLLARWLASSPQVLLLNDPSRGVDHPTKRAMHDIYHRLAESGTAVVLLSSEIEELIQVADSTVVFRDGSVRAVLPRAEITRGRTLSAMFGAVDE